MNRSEFFEMLRDARRASGKKIVDICIELHTTDSTLGRFERGTNNSNMKMIIEYLSCINKKISIEDNSDIYEIEEYEDVVRCFLSLRRKNNKTIRELASILGMTNQTMSNVENKKSKITIDLILSVCMAFNCKVSIVTKNK